jgi:hypothetical protein
MLFRNNAFYARCAKLYRKVGFENINAPWEAPVIHPVGMDAEKICR